MRRHLVASLLAGALVLAGCSGVPARTGTSQTDRSSGEPAETGWPTGLAARIDQSRMQRRTRTAYLRLVNSAEREVEVTAIEMSSPRFGTVEWTGTQTFSREWDFEFEMPRGECGEAVEAEVRVTLRLDDGPPRVASTAAEDVYDAVGMLLDRDCAERTLRAAATLTRGEPRVSGEGRGSVLEIPVILDPGGDRDDVVFEGFDDTVLFRHAEGSAAYPRLRPARLDDPQRPVRTRLRVVPSRCDPHALAEDKVGMLFGVVVGAPKLPDGARFHLPLRDEDRAALADFFGSYCGLAEYPPPGRPALSRRAVPGLRHPRQRLADLPGLVAAGGRGS